MTSKGSDVYNRYIRRFTDKFGEVAEGEPVMNDGQLVRKLSFEDFTEKWETWQAMESHLRESMTRGDTLVDAVEAEYQDLCAAVLEKAKDFKKIVS